MRKADRQEEEERQDRRAKKGRKKKNIRDKRRGKEVTWLFLNEFHLWWRYIQIGLDNICCQTLMLVTAEQDTKGCPILCYD